MGSSDEMQNKVVTLRLLMLILVPLLLLLVLQQQVLVVPSSLLLSSSVNVVVQAFAFDVTVPFFGKGSSTNSLNNWPRPLQGTTKFGSTGYCCCCSGSTIGGGATCTGGRRRLSPSFRRVPLASSTKSALSTTTELFSSSSTSTTSTSTTTSDSETMKNDTSNVASASSSHQSTNSTKNDSYRSDNWRLVRQGDDDEHQRRLLAERPVWDDRQYRDALELHGQLMSCTDSYVAPGIQNALNTLDHAYRLYGPESVIVSFNGGKDAVVILHLVRAAHAKYYNDTLASGGSGSSSSSSNTKTVVTRPRAVYFNHPDEFPEVTSFLEQSVEMYDLDMVAFEEGVKFAAGLEILVKMNFATSSSSSSSKTDGSPESSIHDVVLPMAFVLGTRESDPNAHGQDHFSPSSHWMPPFMRVNPILNWNYGHVWHFLRLFRLSYCSLYDQGYTSLGTVKDTVPCPALAVLGGDETVTEESQTQEGDNTTVASASNNLPRFWPAYMLRDWDQERAGRIKKDKDGRKIVSPKPLKSQAKRINEAVSTSSSFVTSSSSKPPSVSGLTTVSNARLLGKANTTSSIDSNDSTRGEGAAVTNGDDLFLDQSLGSEMSDSDGRQKRVGIIVVGDEILKGMTKDTNTNTAAQALRKECIQLARVVVVSDDVDEIAREIRRLRNEVDVVITSGGVGPTHDDVTIKGVAKSLGQELAFHEEMGELLRQKMNTKDDELSRAQVKMATLPTSSKLRYLSEVPDEWPVLQCRNIFVLPGVPEFFEKKIQNVAAYLSSQLERSVAYKIVLSCDEAVIVDVLNECVVNHPQVDFGSYPFVNHPEYKTVVTLEGSLVDVPPPSQVEESMMENSLDLSVTDRKASRNSVFFDRDALIVPKDVRDRSVRLALDELIRKLPNDSILRVENEEEDNPLDN